MQAVVGEKLYKAGFRNVSCIDISSCLISDLRDRYRHYGFMDCKCSKAKHFCARRSASLCSCNRLFTVMYKIKKLSWMFDSFCFGCYVSVARAT